MADGNNIIRSDIPTLFFSKSEKVDIVEAIKKAELNTSGEIRLHVQGKVDGDIMDAAKTTFENLGMTKTKLRNGTLIFFAIKNRSFAILGDKGIDEKIGKDGWEDLKEHMVDHFKKNEFAEGVIYGIHQISEVLKEHFPYQSDDVNELSDEISFG